MLGLKVVFIIGFLVFIGFAMSETYGIPPFPIRGNVFYGNTGFAFFVLILVGSFIIAWEKFLGHYVERMFDFLSKRIEFSHKLSRSD